MIQVDSHFSIGHSHLNNEDYAISGLEPVPYLIVSDGCSSSRYTDIGARLLSMSAKEFLLDSLRSGALPDIEKLGIYAALKAESAAKIIGIPVSAIDATLIVAFEKGEQIYVYMYGDGLIYSIDEQEQSKITRVDYSHNAPYYLSYKVDAIRDQMYQEKSLTAQKRVFVNGILSIENILRPTQMVFNKTELKSLYIASDGIESFVNTISGAEEDHDSIAREFGEYRNTNGHFVKRRMKRLLKIKNKQGIFNADDLSIGAMVFG